MFEGMFLFQWYSMISFIMALILAHPFGMETSDQIIPTFPTLQLLLSLAQTAEDKQVYTSNLSSTHSHTILSLPLHSTSC